jgi:hypothetical protein
MYVSGSGQASPAVTSGDHIYLSNNGNITASGNISASGTAYSLFNTSPQAHFGNSAPIPSNYQLQVTGDTFLNGDLYTNSNITASGNISASGTITATSFTGSLKGTASTASIATTVTLTATNTTNATHYLTFTDAATGNENVRTDTSLTYNPSSNTLATTAVTATTVSASIVGALAYQYNDPESLVAAGISQGTATAITKAGPIFVTGVATRGIILPRWFEMFIYLQYIICLQPIVFYYIPSRENVLEH